MTATIDAIQLKKVAADPNRGQRIDVRSASEYCHGTSAGRDEHPLEEIGLRIGDLAEQSHGC